MKYYQHKTTFQIVNNIKSIDKYKENNIDFDINMGDEPDNNHNGHSAIESKDKEDEKKANAGYDSDIMEENEWMNV